MSKMCCYEQIHTVISLFKDKFNCLIVGQCMCFQKIHIFPSILQPFCSTTIFLAYCIFKVNVFISFLYSGKSKQCAFGDMQESCSLQHQIVSGYPQVYFQVTDLILCGVILLSFNFTKNILSTGYKGNCTTKDGSIGGLNFFCLQMRCFHHNL